MSLNIPGLPNVLFGQSNVNNEGINTRQGQTKILNVYPTAFLPTHPDVDDIYYPETIEGVLVQGGTVDFLAAINLPDGATILNCKVPGNAGASSKTWFLYRVDSVSNTQTLATANVDTKDSTIIFPLVDNNLYNYVILVEGLVTNDGLESIKIEYID